MGLFCLACTRVNLLNVKEEGEGSPGKGQRGWLDKCAISFLYKKTNFQPSLQSQKIWKYWSFIPTPLPADGWLESTAVTLRSVGVNRCSLVPQLRPTSLLSHLRWLLQCSRNTAFISSTWKQAVGAWDSTESAALFVCQARWLRLRPEKGQWRWWEIVRFRVHRNLNLNGIGGWD